MTAPISSCGHNAHVRWCADISQYDQSAVRIAMNSHEETPGDRKRETDAPSKCESSTLFRPHRLDDLHRFDAHTGDALEKIDHLILVIREAIIVQLVTGGHVFGRLFLILVENPFER